MVHYGVEGSQHQELVTLHPSASSLIGEQLLTLSFFLHLTRSWILHPGDNPTHSQDGASHTSWCSKHAQQPALQAILDSVTSTIKSIIYNSALGK